MYHPTSSVPREATTRGSSWQKPAVIRAARGRALAGHALRDVQRMVDRRQHDADAEADALGALADRRQCQVRRAVVRPYRAEMVLGKPHGREALLLGKRNLLERLIDALRFALRGPRFGNLDLIEKTQSHRALRAGL